MVSTTAKKKMVRVKRASQKCVLRDYRRLGGCGFGISPCRLRHLRACVVALGGADLDFGALIEPVGADGDDRVTRRETAR